MYNLQERAQRTRNASLTPAQGLEKLLQAETTAHAAARAEASEYRHAAEYWRRASIIARQRVYDAQSVCTCGNVHGSRGAVEDTPTPAEGAAEQAPLHDAPPAPEQARLKDLADSLGVDLGSIGAA